MLPGQIIFRNKASILLLKILSSHKHMKDFEKSYNFFSPKLCLIQSFSRFSFSFSPFFPLSLHPSLLPSGSLPPSLLPFLPSFFGGEWWRGSNPLASHYLGGQNKRNISTLDLPFRLFAFELEFGKKNDLKNFLTVSYWIVDKYKLLFDNHPTDIEYTLNARLSLGC